MVTTYRGNTIAVILTVGLISAYFELGLEPKREPSSSRQISIENVRLGMSLQGVWEAMHLNTHFEVENPGPIHLYSSGPLKDLNYQNGEVQALKGTEILINSKARLDTDTSLEKVHQELGNPLCRNTFGEQFQIGKSTLYIRLASSRPENIEYFIWAMDFKDIPKNWFTTES